jgi:hypothetical protein
MNEIHAGVPLVVFERRTEEEQIEAILRDLIEEDAEPAQLRQQPPANNEPQDVPADGLPPDTNLPTNSVERWPTQGPDPINEYTTEGYITMAFPALFPYGKADLRDQSNRKVEVGTAEYFDALLRYKDGRFGSHPRYYCSLLSLIQRFPFYALNTKLRTQAQSQAQMYIRTYPGAENLTIDDIRQKLNSEQKSAFLKSIQRTIDWIPGLSPFWHRHRNQLSHMIEQLGSLHLFFTLSAADLHWPDLHRLIEDHRRQHDPENQAQQSQPTDNQLTHDRRIDNLTKYPHLVAKFLQERVQKFFQHMKKIPEFEYVEYWYRYEWQHRGSGHVHGFLWLKDGPNIDNVNFENENERQQLAEFFSRKVFAYTPLPNHPRPARHPCQIPEPLADSNNQVDLAELLNRCQRHSTCLPSYCIRYNRRLKRNTCRFGFPHSPNQDPKIEKNDKGQWTFIPSRPLCDRDLNRYHPIWTSMWRGNIDISPVLGKNAAINYIAKYASKAESISRELDKVMLDIAENLAETDGIAGLITKTLNRFCIERDFSAQEACHQILHLPMVECSRTFVSINLPNDLSVKRLFGSRRQSRRSRNAIPASDDNVPDDETVKSTLENYMARDPTDELLRDISYYDIIKQYTWNKTRKCWSRRTKKHPIVQIYPRNWEESLKPNNSMLNFGRNTSKFATAARRALMLYVPFEDIHHLTDVTQHSDPDPNRRARFYDPAAATTDNDVRWRDCFVWEIEHRSHLFPSTLINLFYDINPSDFDMEVDPDSESEWDSTPEILRRQDQEWQRAARIPQHGQQARMGRPSEYFGTRDIDLQHNWDSDLESFEVAPDLETFIESHKKVEVAEGINENIVRPEMLNEGQRKVYNHIVEGFSHSEDNLSTIVMGTAGVGKSFLIRALEHRLWTAAREKFGEQDYPTIRSVVKLAAFTGKAAFQVKGVTIHSLLSMSGDLTKPDPLRGERLKRLQTDFKNTHFLFLDEMSMIGMRLLSRIDGRLRECRPHFHDKPFGGVSVVLFGDYAQLPPVGDIALYAPVSDQSPAALRWDFMLYRQAFTSAFQLTQQMRQQGQSEMDHKFQLALSHLRLGDITIEDWEFFQSRVISHLPLDDQPRFQNVIRLFGTKAEVKETNTSKLENLGKPVARLEAKYSATISSVEGAKVQPDDCQGLEHLVYLSVGCRVFIL